MMEPLHDKLSFMFISHSILLRMRNVSDKICTENQNTHFVFNIFFFQKIVVFLDNMENYGKVRLAKDYNIIWITIALRL